MGVQSEKYESSSSYNTDSQDSMTIILHTVVTVLAVITSVSGDGQTCSARLPLEPPLCKEKEPGIVERGKAEWRYVDKENEEESGLKAGNDDRRAVCGAAARRKDVELAAPWLRNVFLGVIITFPFLLLFVLMVSSSTSEQKCKTQFSE